MAAHGGGFEVYWSQTFGDCAGPREGAGGAQSQGKPGFTRSSADTGWTSHPCQDQPLPPRHGEVVTVGPRWGPSRVLEETFPTREVTQGSPPPRHCQGGVPAAPGPGGCSRQGGDPSLGPSCATSSRDVLRGSSPDPCWGGCWSWLGVTVGLCSGSALGMELNFQTAAN